MRTWAVCEKPDTKDARWRKAHIHCQPRRVRWGRPGPFSLAELPSRPEQPLTQGVTPFPRLSAASRNYDDVFFPEHLRARSTPHPILLPKGRRAGSGGTRSGPELMSPYFRHRPLRFPKHLPGSNRDLSEAHPVLPTPHPPTAVCHPRTIMGVNQSNGQSSGRGQAVQLTYSTSASDSSGAARCAFDPWRGGPS
jgi:hypothetical protein